MRLIRRGRDKMKGDAAAAVSAAYAAAERAKLARAESERSLTMARATVIRRLREMRRENHFAEAIYASIRRDVADAEGDDSEHAPDPGDSD